VLIKDLYDYSYMGVAK